MMTSQNLLRSYRCQQCLGSNSSKSLPSLCSYLVEARSEVVIVVVGAALEGAACMVVGVADVNGRDVPMCDLPSILSYG